MTTINGIALKRKCRLPDGGTVSAVYLDGKKVGWFIKPGGDGNPQIITACNAYLEMLKTRAAKTFEEIMKG